MPLSLIVRRFIPRVDECFAYIDNITAGLSVHSHSQRAIENDEKDHPYDLRPAKADNVLSLTKVGRESLQYGSMHQIV